MVGLNKQKFLKLVSDEKTNTVERNRRRIKYRKFIRLKRKIKLKWLLFKDKLK